MININIQNSLSQIQNVSKDTEQLIKDSLKYLSQNVSYQYHKNMREINRIRNLLGDKRFQVETQHLNSELTRLERQNQALLRSMYVYLYKKGEFPTGLLPKVVDCLETAGLEYKINDLRVRPELGQVKYVLKESFPLMRYYQKTAARLAKEKGRGIIVAPTGTGKTLTVARLIWELGVKTLVITPSKAITDNMVDTLTHYFGKGRVAKLSTKKAALKDINVVNIQALIKLKAEDLADIQAVVIDEFHHSAAETYQEINFNHLKHCYYRIGVTATNFRNDGSDIALEGVLSEVLYEYSIEQAIADGFLVKPEFKIQPNKTESRNSYQTEYKNGIVENSNRNELIANIATTHSKDSVLILVQQLEHGSSLKELIPGSEFLHGEEKDDVRQNVMEAYRKGKVKVLIGTSVIGEGVDLPIANVLILAGGGKAKSQVMQNVGRVLRPFAGKDKALVYDFTDEGSNFLSEHALLRQEIYNLYG